MPIYQQYAQAGAVAFVVLALLHLLVWRVQRQRWSLLLATIYAIGVVVYGFDAYLQPTEARAHWLGGSLGALALVLMTLALIDYVGLAPRAARLGRVLAIGVASVMLGLRLAGLMPRVGGSAGYAAYFVAQAGLIVWAMRREPRSGHGLVLAALLLYPAMFATVVAGWFDVPMLRYLVIVPGAVTGVTILTTGLLRAQRRAATELQRREHAEQALQALNETLEHQVAQRTEELREMVAGLESFNRSVSHDLRGPLGGIAGVSRLAGEALERGDLATVARLLPVVTAQAESSSQLVAALLALARVGEVDLQPQPIDMEAFVRETIEQLRLSEPASAAVPMQVHGLPRVKADPALLRQVVVNLVGNAVKFAGASPAPRVEIGSEPGEGGEQVFYVRDNGVGFDEARAAGLFEPFQRMHGAQFQGHGVGLSIVKRIVERHGGRVWARSRPGQGATFYFTLRGSDQGTLH